MKLGIEAPFSFFISLIVMAGGVLILDSATFQMAWFLNIHWERIDNGFFWGAIYGTVVICLGIIFTFLSLMNLGAQAISKDETDEAPSK
jgi:hypothetical protein